MNPSPVDPGTLEEIKALLGSKRMRERLRHLRYYRDESPGQSLMIGLQLSAAALQTREKRRTGDA